MTNTFIAYTRVSTQKQGNEGVSLTEQRRAIESYARRRHLKIAKCYEELATAATQGRPVFQTVLSLLDRDAGKTGLVLHKIDRGARNLRDWADIGELLDQGIEVRFAHDDLDLWTRGGRLTADIQAVIASYYINVQGRTYQGKHQPLVTDELFGRVQEMLARKRPKRNQKHCFQYSRCLRCSGCENFLIEEKQKQFVYYRCHSCTGVCIREDRVSASDPRFHVISEATNSEHGQLEPWEKFDSLSGIDSSCNVFSDQRLS